MDVLLESLLMIPGVRNALGELLGHLAPPFIIALIVLWASGKFLKEDVAGKKFAIDMANLMSDPDKKPMLDVDLIPLVLLVEGIVLATVYCGVFGYGDGWLQRATFAIVGGFGSGLLAYCVASGLYDATHGALKHRETRKEAQK